MTKEQHPSEEIKTLLNSEKKEQSVQPYEQYFKEFIDDIKNNVANSTLVAKIALANTISRFFNLELVDIKSEEGKSDEENFKLVSEAVYNRIVETVEKISEDAKEKGDATLLIAAHSASVAVRYYDSVVNSVEKDMPEEPTKPKKKK